MGKYIKSPINYNGSKFKLLKDIVPLFPSDINIFVDLFGGSFNVGVNIEANKIIYNDIILYLSQLIEEMYKTPKKEIIQHINNRIKEFNLSKTNKEGFIQFRNYYNKNKNPLDLYVLLCFSFNNYIRFNSKHDFNSSFGKDCSYFNPSMENNLNRFIETIQGKDIEFTSISFEDFKYDNLIVGDFVYADPPYLISSAVYNDGKRGFTGWSDKEEYALLSILDSLNERGIKFALSNVLEHKGVKNEILIDWAKKYNITYINKKYNLSKIKSKSVEVLITNY